MGLVKKSATGMFELLCKRGSRFLDFFLDLKFIKTAFELTKNIPRPK
jgi:hypothetical protein